MLFKDSAHTTLFSRARDVAREYLLPLVDAAPADRVNRPLLEGMHQHGLLSELFPDVSADEHETSAVKLCILREAIALECTAAETALALQGLGAYPILEHGRAEVVARWIPAVARGEAVAAFALSEPEAGSDAASLQLRAERGRDGHFCLNGTKTWISNAPEADIYTVFARTGEDRHNVTAFAVPGDSPGLRGRHLSLLAPHPIGELEFDDVEVDETHVLGEVGSGFRVAMSTLDRFRPSVGAFAIGMARRALELTISYANSRQAFGAPLSDRQALTHGVADLATRLEAARLLVYKAADAFDEHAADRTQLAAMAKLLATETAQEIVDTAVQVHGARGLEIGHPLEHLYREVRAPRIYEGASEIQREVIARKLFAQPDSPSSIPSAVETRKTLATVKT